MSTEDWRPVAGYEDLYQVSSKGQVRSLDRIDSRGHLRKGRLLSPRGERHRFVVLCRDAVERKFYIHRLVLTAFIGPPPESHPLGCHLDDDQSNNALENLYWGTYSSNLADAVRNGRREGRSGAPASKLSHDDVREIRRRAHLGERQSRIADDYSISQSAVSLIATGRTWQNVA